MMFALVKDSKNLSMYGDIPEVTFATFDEAETYYGDWDDAISIRDNLLSAIDEHIEDNLLDLSDIEYFDKERCVILKQILENKMSEPCSKRLHELYDILYGYVLRAIELGTGVEIEL